MPACQLILDHQESALYLYWLQGAKEFGARVAELAWDVEGREAQGT